MDKSDIMEESLFKNVKIESTYGDTIEGKVEVFETAYDNDEGEASICIQTNEGEGLCIFESEIETIEIL